MVKPDARARDRAEARCQSEPIAAIERAVVIGEQELPEPERERTGEGDLERRQDVLRTRAEEQQQRRTRSRNPRPGAGASNDGPQQPRRREVEHDRDELVGQVRTEAENREQCAEDHERERNQVAAVLRQQIVKTQAAPGEEVPFVAPEPEIAAGNEEEHERDCLQADERPTGDPFRGSVVSRVFDLGVVHESAIRGAQRGMSPMLLRSVSTSGANAGRTES